MKTSLDAKYPEAFGRSKDDFIKKYQNLIYKIILEKRKDGFILEKEECFNDFIIHIEEDNFKRLRQFQGKSKPSTYISKVLFNFLRDLLRKESTRRKYISNIEDDNTRQNTMYETDDASNNPEEILLAKENSTQVNMALEATFDGFSDRQKLIFGLFFGFAGVDEKRMTAKDIAKLIDENEKKIYKTIEKIKKKLKDELKKRGIELP